MTKRQQIVLDFIDKLKSIKTANGFKTNSGNDVGHWNSLIIPAENSEYLNVRDEDTDFETVTHNAHSPVLQLYIDFACSKKNDSWEHATFIQADIYKCIGDNIDFFISKYGTVRFYPIGDSLDIVMEDKIYAEGYVRIELEYKIEPWKFIND